MNVIFAHYGGIDEIGVFVVPAVLAILALRWAERRAKRAAAEKDGEPDMEAVSAEEGTDGD
ncbi:MAG TPA: hypothetical protein VFU96_02215 [Acidimicrobiia bacterium]|nr:hypothetical protein [Acidimicrobiia bacterium]